MPRQILSKTSAPFRLHSEFPPAGDQPKAIAQLVEGLQSGLSHQTLLGVTGSGKTFTMANVIARMGRPALVLAPNKTLAAQLYSEFREFFPENAIEYFVSYYDYYQPEAYVPSRDLFIVPGLRTHEYVRASDNGIRAKVGIDATVLIEEKERFARAPFRTVDVTLESFSSSDPGVSWLA